MKITDLVRPNILALSPYSTARDEYQGEIGIYLDANENPYNNGFNRYPDPYQKALKTRLGELKGLSGNQIFIGNGSDEAIDLIYRIFCEPGIDEALSIAPTYGMYKVSANINNVTFNEIPLNKNFELESDTLLSAVTPRTKVIFLCSPNNPSGNLLSKAEVEKVIRNFKGIVVVDEAYIDFADDAGFLPHLNEFKNLIVLQTLSKAWGLAGLRLGLSFACQEITSLMTRIKYPYNINVLTQQTVLDQLMLAPQKTQECRTLIAERERVKTALDHYCFIEKIYPSHSNFILIRTTNAAEHYRYLIAGGIIVRDRSQVIGCANCLRITIGTPSENDKLLTLLTQIELLNQ